MKKIVILIAALLSLTLIGASAQETPPAGLKPINAQFYIHLPDSTIWQFKGAPYNWHRIAKYSDIKNLPTQAVINGKIDSLKAANNVWTGTTNTYNGTVQINGNFNMTGNSDITGEGRATTMFSGSTTTNNLHIGTGVGGAYLDFISTGPFPYPYNWRMGNNVGGLDDYFYIKYKTAETLKIDTFNRVFIDTLKDNSGKYYQKANTKVVAGDSTRNITFTLWGSSVTRGAPNGTAYVDSGYVVKYSNLQGIKTNNYGLSGRAVQQITGSDSSIYSKRFSSPTYTPGSYIGCECLINDASRDSTVYTIATYTTQLTAWVDAQIAAGYPANHILLFNAAYFNNPAAATFPNTENRHDQYAAAMLAVATAKGTLFYDGYYTYKTLYTATPSLLDASVLHPTDAGTTIIANALYNYLKTYITTVSDVNPQLLVSGNEKVYRNLTVGNYLKLETTPSTLLPNSTQPLLGYDATDQRVKTKILYPVDLKYTIGASGNTGSTDCNDITNTQPGYGPNLILSSAATNAPYSNSGSFHLYNIEYGTARNGTGNITQIAYPYTSTTSAINGTWIRFRNSGTWTAWKLQLQVTNSAAQGQVYIGQLGGNPTATTVTGDVTITSAGVTAIKSAVALTGVPTAPTAAAATNTTQIATTQFVTTADNLKANIASPTFTGTVTIPSPFTLGATSVTTTGAKLNFLTGAAGTTGGSTSSLVFSNNPQLITPRLTGYTVATLPAGTIGMMAYVTDAITPVYLGPLTGGGTVVTPVFYNGTAWISY